VTHDLDEARRASRVVVMENGRVAFDGARSEFDGVSRVDLSRWGLVSGGSDADAESRRPRPGSGGNVVARARIRVGGDEREVELRAGRAIAVTGDLGAGRPCS
jgi:ABC-type sulfate/molybdate transport systems ATPase subunit